MRKKEYISPRIKAVELQEEETLLTQSQTPSGYSIYYGDEDEIPTIQNSIWDR